MDTKSLSVCVTALALTVTCLMIPLLNAQVQSETCPTNCINQTCSDPNTAQYFCTLGCINETEYGNQCRTPCPPNCLTCYRFYRQTWECYGCKDGYYSTDVEMNCTKRCPTGCSTCYSDTNCTSCSPGYYQAASSANCSKCPSTCDVCFSDTNCSECIANFEGNACDRCVDGKYGINCTTDCPTSCNACNSNINCSECKEGFNGISCQYCIDGKYGEDCNLHCLDRCQTCTSKDVCTVCKSGFYNGIYRHDNITNCNQTDPPCPTNCFECANTSYCTQCRDGFFNSDTSMTCTNVCPSNCIACVSDTNCTDCKGNFSGDTCDMCVDGKYGDYCINSCPSTCSACLSRTNCTTCYDGYYNGPSPTNGTSVYNDCRFDCPDTCTKCINYTYCDACQQHFHGPACNECADGWHGEACNETCPTNCLNNICNRTTGVCFDCQTRFSGDECDMCVLGLHGDQCYSSCSTDCLNSSCERFSANCSSGCTYPNLTGATCDTCLDGYHGTNCNSTCPGNCFMDRCSRSNGFCFECKENFSGSICETCIPGKHGQNCNLNCSGNCKNDTCDRMTGNCSYGCEYGFSGDTCCLDNLYCNYCSSDDECEVCISGMYGTTCNQTCSINCVGKVCQKNNGMCSDCKNHYYGSVCEIPCPENCSDVGTGDNRCNRTSGHCVDECIHGSYGNMCNETCSLNCVNNTCTKLTGECLQCKPNYKGNMCNVVESTVAETQTSLIAGICSVMAVVVIIGVIVLIVVLKRRNKNEEPSPCWKSRLEAKACGKTTFVKELLQHHDSRIQPSIQRIVWLYRRWQPLYALVQRTVLPRVQFIQGIPGDLDDDDFFDPTVNNLLVIDDLFSEAGKDKRITGLYTEGSHHRSLSVIGINQNLYGTKDPTQRRNCHYLVLFKNPMDNQVIVSLARQMYPGRSDLFMKAFSKATKDPYGYLLVDLKPFTLETERLKSRVVWQYENDRILTNQEQDLPPMTIKEETTRTTNHSSAAVQIVNIDAEQQDMSDKMNYCDDCGLLFDTAHDVQRHVKRGWCAESQEPPMKKRKLEETESESSEIVEENEGYIHLWELAKKVGKDRYKELYGRYVSQGDTEKDASDMAKERVKPYEEKCFFSRYSTLLVNYWLPLRHNAVHQRVLQHIQALTDKGVTSTSAVKRVLRKVKPKFEDLFDTEVSGDEQDSDNEESTDEDSD